MALSEASYRADLELLDRYVGFSSEIVRVSLLGLAAIGFYLKEFVAPAQSLEAGWFHMLLGGSGFLLTIAVACGLLHRYYATDGFASHIKHLRTLDEGDAREAERAAGSRIRQYKLSGAWLTSSGAVAACGVAVLGIAFGVRFGVLGSIPKETIALPLAGAALGAATVVVHAGWARALRRLEQPLPREERGHVRPGV